MQLTQKVTQLFSPNLERYRDVYFATTVSFRFVEQL